MSARRKTKPTWGLLNPSSILDGAEAPFLLGRIVVNVDDLIEGYVPEDPREFLKSLPEPEPMEVVDTDVETFISTTADAKAQARLNQIFGVSAAGSQQHDRQVRARTVITRMLRQHDKVFSALMKTHGSQVVELLGKQTTQRGYLVVGLKTCVDAEIFSSDRSSTEGGITLEVPLQAAAMAFGASPLPTELISPSISVNKANSRSLLSRFVATGERIFSVRIREVKFHGFIYTGLRMGQPHQFPPQQGTFGGGGRKIEDSNDQEVKQVDVVDQVTLERAETVADAEKMLFASFLDVAGNSSK